MLFNEPFGGIFPGARSAVLAALLRTGTPLTGRQVHGLLSDKHSLWAVQEALKALNKLGLVETQTIGRAGVHTINGSHHAVAPLRVLLSPMAALRAAVEEVAGTAEAVILFGSIARGEATADSDIDLAVIAPEGWSLGVELEESVRTRVGNDCDVLVFTPSELDRLAASGEPVVNEIMRDGIALVGTRPRAKQETA